MLKTYYMLTKPGIIAGNLLTTVAGFALAFQSGMHFNLLFFLETVIGLGFVIASACVSNNYIDRVADQKMSRTADRALAKGLIKERSALVYAVVLGVLGSITLLLSSNLLALGVALSGFFIYVGLYSLFKYHTTYATLIGSISGAVPPVVGYVALAGKLDLGALILFLVLVLWQMPHFYAISLFRLEDYRKANIPVLPLIKGNHVTKIHILLYVIAFIGSLLLLTTYSHLKTLYFYWAIAFGFGWLALSIWGFCTKDTTVWAKQMFVLSLVIILGFSTIISANFFI